MINIYVGWDEKDAQAYEVCRQSLLKRASIPINIIPLKHWELRAKKCFWRSHMVTPDGQMIDDRDGKPMSTTFSFTRFLVPHLEEYEDRRAIFVDPDVLWRCDVKTLLDACVDDYAVWCVKHDHMPIDSHKFNTHAIQTRYRKKNWSSLMVFNPSKCRGLSLYAVNNQPGSHLHAMLWVHEDQIGGLPEEYNWLEGHSDPEREPKILHYTRGTPDMVPNLPYEEEWWRYAQEEKEEKEEILEGLKAWCLTQNEERPGTETAISPTGRPYETLAVQGAFPEIETAWKCLYKDRVPEGAKVWWRKYPTYHPEGVLRARLDWEGR